MLGIMANMGLLQSPELGREISWAVGWSVTLFDIFCIQLAKNTRTYRWSRRRSNDAMRM